MIVMPLPVPEVTEDDQMVMKMLQDLSDIGAVSQGRYYFEGKIYIVNGDTVTVSSEEGTLYLGKLS